MAITSIGFDGVMNESAWVKLTQHVGRNAVVSSEAAYAVTTVSGVDRTVSVAGSATAQAYQHGVLVGSTAAEQVQLATVASGTRWDTIVVRRNWTPNTSAVTYAQGGTSQAVSGSVKADTPGTGETDQPIALVQVTAGQQVPTAVVDLREFLTVGGVRRFGSTSARDLWWPSPVAGDRAYVGTALYEYTGSAWRLHDTGWIDLSLVAVTWIEVTSGTDNPPPGIWVRRVGQVVHLRGTVQRNGATIPATGGDNPIVNLSGEFLPAYTHPFVTRMHNSVAHVHVNPAATDRHVRLDYTADSITTGQWLYLDTTWIAG